MKKPICKKGLQCSEWKKDLFHTVLFMHGPEGPAAKEVENNEEIVDGDDESPPAKKRAVERGSETDLHQAFLEEKYLVTFPPDFFRFWNNLNQFHNKKDDLCSSFQSMKNLKLVGPFQTLLELLSKKKAEHDETYYLTSHRFATDLPEMQTLAVYNGGRYAYWRDTPKSKDVLIIHVKHDDEHFPKAEIIGDADPRWILVHLGGNKAPEGFSVGDRKLWTSLQKTYVQEVKKVARDRKKNSYGDSFHGIGFYVEVKDDVGYRPLENPPPEKLKKMLKDLGSCKDDKKKGDLKGEIMTVTTWVDIANDEMDYSLGLEVGHDFFWSNYPDVDRLTEITLSNSYTLLEREEFKTILKAHMKVRRADPELNH